MTFGAKGRISNSGIWHLTTTTMNMTRTEAGLRIWVREYGVRQTFLLFLFFRENVNKICLTLKPKDRIYPGRGIAN
jgi:hypothetical protein